jgi:hypothetical protein
MAIRAAIGHRFFTTCRNTDAKGLAVLDQSESVFASSLVLSWHAWVAPWLSLAAAENPNMLTGAGLDNENRIDSGLVGKVVCRRPVR